MPVPATGHCTPAIAVYAKGLKRTDPEPRAAADASNVWAKNGQFLIAVFKCHVGMALNPKNTHMTQHRDHTVLVFFCD